MGSQPFHQHDEILVNGENTGIPNWVVLHPQKQQQIIRDDKITAHMAQNGFVFIEMDTYVFKKMLNCCGNSGCPESSRQTLVSPIFFIHRYHLWLCFQKCIGDKSTTLEFVVCSLTLSLNH